MATRKKTEKPPLATGEVHAGDNDPAIVAARAAQASRYRVMGLTYAQIAEQIGYANAGSVRRLILTSAQRETKENLEELRAIENDRMDLATATLTSIIGSRDKDDVIRIRAVDSLVRVSARRAALNGLDKPIQVQVMARAQATLAELSELVMGVVVGEMVPPLALEGPTA